jgi:hypothetical protein
MRKFGLSWRVLSDGSLRGMNKAFWLLRQRQIREIRVFVIDAHLHVMRSVADLAVEMGEIHLLASLPGKRIVLRKSATCASGRAAR